MIQEPACKIRAHALIPVSHLDAQRRPGRRRGHQPSTHAARRADPPPRRRALFVAAHGPQDLEEGRADHSRGNGPRRGPGAVHADGAAGRTVEGIGPLEQVRAGTAALQGSSRSGIRLWPDPRGSHHGHRTAGAAQLQAAAGEFLSNPVEVPRRDPPPLRRDARPRVPDEGRLFVPPRSGRPRAGLPPHVRGLHPHFHPHGPEVSRRSGRRRQHRRQRLAGVSRARRLRGGCDRVLHRRRLRLQHGDRGNPGALGTTS